jgi:hypothetical protein
LNKNLNQGYIYNHDIIYKITKFCKLAANKGKRILPISFILKIKNIQKTKIKTKCQNFASKQIVTVLLTILVLLNSESKFHKNSSESKDQFKLP